jgi:hypothetical protein
MITLISLIIIWFIISLYKFIHENDVDNPFYNAGLVIGGLFTIVIVLLLIVVFLP